MVDYLKDMGTSARLQQFERDFSGGGISGQKRSAIFLDRDGTLNVEKGHIADPQQLQLFPGVGAALGALREAGFLLILVTNQSVIARGRATEAEVAAIHRRLELELEKAGAFLDAIYICPHHPNRGFPGERPELKIVCECRKPEIGLIKQACHDFPIDLASSWVIGDQTRDIEMARRAGLRSILVQTGITGSDGAFDAKPDHIVADLAQAAKLIVIAREAERSR
jgi:histidinol-phosphate phosphatase family protein